MNQKEIAKSIRAKLAEHYRSRFQPERGRLHTPPPDLHKNNKDWWRDGCDITLKDWYWYAGDNEIDESCRQGYERFVSQGISHIRLFGRPYDPEQTRDQSFDQRYIQYVNAAGEVIDEEEA